MGVGIKKRKLRMKNTNKKYLNFLSLKEIKYKDEGFIIDDKKINPMMYDFQKAITKWTLKKGKAAVFADCGLGKGQPINSKILTPNGWKKMRDLQLGDKAISSNGKAYPIIGIYPKKEIDTYRFYFSDESSFVVDIDHLHIIRTNNDRQRGKNWRVLSTRELILASNLKYGKNRKSRNYDIPIVSPIDFNKKKLSIHPYILGVLLGDGCLRHSISLSKSDRDIEIISKIKRLLGNKYDVVKKGYSKIEKNIIYTKNNKNPLIDSLRKLKLFGCYTHEKFIPKEYLFSDIDDRLELLRGLLDTDGYIKDTTQYYTTSKQLAYNVLFLVRSLGGIPTLHQKNNPKYIHNNESRHGRTCYVLTFSLKTFNPFYLKRKAELWNSNPRDNGRWIDRIEYEKRQKTICISVDSPDNSYVTENCIVTHNTPIQLEWAKHVHKKTNQPILIFAPLAVSKQTKREGEKFGIEVNICRNNNDIINGVNITNYEMLKHFVNDSLGGLVLDESSILKGFDGSFKRNIIDFAQSIPFRLACTATPSPNDLVEIINHAEFLGIMKEKEIKALFFTNRAQDIVQKWVLKEHAKKDFWKWLSSWSVALRMPSDLGYDDNKFILPKLHIKQIVTKSNNTKARIRKMSNGLQIKTFFPKESKTLKEQQKARRDSIDGRIRECSELVNNSSEQWLIWCDLNEESRRLKETILDSIEVKGSNKIEYKEKAMLDFQNKKIRALITKPSIAGHGMNWQNCHNMAFVGLSHSYEKLYQATRRCWRFGQEKEVHSYHIVDESEGEIVKNIKRKEKEAKDLFDNIIKHMNLEGQLSTKREEMIYMEEMKKGKGWELYLGDSILTMDKIKTESIGLSIFSPPFPGMYVYTNSKHDIGNTGSIEELIEQFRFLVCKDKLYRITMPGRHCCIHLTQGVAFKSKDNYIGIKDFRGKVIQMMEEEGWIYYGEVCIDKCPQIRAIRTKDRGLLFKTLSKDSSLMHPALADYLLQFVKPGDNPNPIPAGISRKYNDKKGWITTDEWIEWAAPVWYRQTPYYPGGIKETDVLKFRNAKDKKDEKHLAPLQLGVIERAIKMWSAPKEVIYSPFAGIGSEGYVALQLDRKFIGGELKKSYFDIAVKNLKSVVKRNTQLNLFQGTPIKKDVKV
jgi:DNA modification methylase